MVMITMMTMATAGLNPSTREGDRCYGEFWAEFVLSGLVALRQTLEERPSCVRLLSMWTADGEQALV